MDTHKKQHKVALHYRGDEHIVQFTVKNNAPDIKKMVNKVKKQAPADVKFCYEAGICGFTLKRRIEAVKRLLDELTTFFITQPPKPDFLIHRSIRLWHI